MEWYKQNIVTVIHSINTGPQKYCTVIEMFLWKQSFRTEKTNTLLVLCCLSLTLCLCKDTLTTLTSCTGYTTQWTLRGKWWCWHRNDIVLAVQFFFHMKMYIYTTDKFIKCRAWWFSSVQFSSVAQSCPTLCDPMNGSTPGLPVHHQLPEFTQTHVHQVSDAIQPSHPLSSSFPPAPNPSQHHSLFQWVNSLHEVAKVLEFQL